MAFNYFHGVNKKNMDLKNCTKMGLDLWPQNHSNSSTNLKLSMKNEFQIGCYTGVQFMYLWLIWTLFNPFNQVFKVTPNLCKLLLPIVWFQKICIPP